MNPNNPLTGKFQQSINLTDLCSVMNTFIQQRINHLRFLILLWFCLFHLY